MRSFQNHLATEAQIVLISIIRANFSFLSLLHVIRVYTVLLSYQRVKHFIKLFSKDFYV